MPQLVFELSVDWDDTGSELDFVSIVGSAVVFIPLASLTNDFKHYVSHQQLGYGHL